MNTAANWLCAAVIAAVMSTTYMLDGPEDHQAEWAASTELAELQASAAKEARRDRAAIELCIKAHGLGAAVQWTADGSLLCRARR